ncbi:hypothetical protein BY996DRAFT_7488922 [Phakopsora pachyrhizi]|nr:hypothetical protein BY996DRAFT_7488922 [Phakopsora pachyrhizi]
MSFGTNESNPFRISLIYQQPFFLLTTVTSTIVWIIAFIAQCLAEAKYHHTTQDSKSERMVGTPIGIGWFAIFYQLLISFWIIDRVGRELEYDSRHQISVMVAVNVVSGVISSDRGIYSKDSIGMTIFGFAWLVLSAVNVLWLIYFSSPEDSKIISLLNPTFSRRQFIKSTINIRRSVPAFNNEQSVINLDTKLPHSPYGGVRDISNAGFNQQSYSNLNPEKSSYPIPSVGGHWHPENHHYGSEEYQHGNNPMNLSHPNAISSTASLTPLVQNQLNYPQNYDDQHQQLVLQYSQYASTQDHQPQSTSNPVTHLPPQQTVQQPFNHTSTVNSSQITSQIPINGSVPYTSSQPSTEPSTTHQSQTSASDLPNPVKRAQALYNYSASANDPNEISFEKGEILEIRNNQGKWWQARKVTGQIGIVPSNYMKLLDQ